MVAPDALVMLSPLVAGTLFGVETLARILASALVSGVQVVISASNSDGAWDNAKKYIEAGASEEGRSLGPKGSDAHKAKKYIEALLFAPFFATHGGLIFIHL